MLLNIKPHNKNTYPVMGILIKGANAASWIKEIQLMGMVLDELKVHPIPGVTANSVWGCLVMPFGSIDKARIGKNELCQMVAPNLLIPERTMLYPVVTMAELAKLFTTSRHVFHPEFGLTELTEVFKPEELLLLPIAKSVIVRKPQASAFVPNTVKSYRIKEVSAEDIIKNMEENLFPKKEQMKTEPLSLLEKGRHAFYKLLFNNPIGDKIGKSVLLTKLEAWLKKGNGKGIGKLVEKMQEDFEDLDERNQKQVDKLLKMLHDNPEEALKYAVPLDGDGSTRGGARSSLELTGRWSSFSLFGDSRPTGSGSVNLGDHYYRLQTQYMKTAEELIKQKNYQKAAFVYMKLLKNYRLAAQTLESGELYKEAATIYLKYDNNKQKAAQCYEKASMTDDAIGLYKELLDHEKVGDLYLSLHNRKTANEYYNLVVDSYKSKSQFVKASLIYRDKMEQKLDGQAILLEGWRKNKDAYNCLNNYFANIDDVKILGNEVNEIYAKDTNSQNSELFLKSIKHIYKKNTELSEPIKELAYEIIAQEINANPSIVSELKEFNVTDTNIIKDIMKYKMNLRAATEKTKK